MSKPSEREQLIAIGYMEGVNDAVDTIVSLIKESARYFDEDSNWLALRIAGQSPGMKFDSEMAHVEDRWRHLKRNPGMAESASARRSAVDVARSFRSTQS